MKVVRSCILLSCLAVGCMPMEKGAVKVNINRKFQKDSSQVNSISIVNNQLIISGSHLSGVEKIVLKNNSVNENFSIESASDSQLIANTLGNVSLAAETIFDLILSSAAGASTYQVTFTLSDGSVTTSKIVDGAVTGTKLGIPASRGEFLKFNGTTWVAASVYDAQTYLGTWDATTMVLPTPIGNAGEYYIVSDDATFGSPAVHYRPGDWIISDGMSWKKIVYSSGVTSFNTRKGIVSLQPSDYSFLVDSGTHKVTGSKLVDIADINVTSLTDGQVLKWDSSTSKWVNGTGGGGVPAITASAPLVYSSGALSISAATTSDAGTMSSADKTKLDSVPTFPTGDGLLEKFSGIFLMKTCSPGQMLVFFSGTGWTCSTTLVMEGGSAQTIGMSRNPTSNTAGNNLTVEASGATSSATDKSGGSLILSGGTSTGTGSSTIEFKTATATTTGTADNTPSTKMTILGNGNVGIGTTDPKRRLTVQADDTSKLTAIAIYNANTTANNGSVVSFRTDTTGTGGTSFVEYAGYQGGVNDHNHATRSGDMSLFSIRAGVPSYLMLKAGGNVGMGTVTPAAALHVDKTALTGTISSSGTTITGVGTNFTAAFSVGDEIVSALQVKTITAITSATSLTVNTAFASDLTAGASYTRVGAIVTAGNVGIGTDIPAVKLDVNGDARFANTTYYDSNVNVPASTYVPINLASNSSTLVPGNVYRISLVTPGTGTITGAVYLIYQTNATTWATSLVSSGGNTSNHPLLRINVAGTGLEVYHNHVGLYSIHSFVNTFTTNNLTTTGATFFGLESAMTNLGGYVGIGTNTPSEKLHVMGKGVFESNQIAGINEVAKFVDSANGLVDRGVKTGFYVASGTGSNRLGAEISAANESTLTSSYLTFNTENTGTVAERVRVTGVGNVGIGTNTPLTKLDVRGTAYYQLRLQNNLSSQQLWQGAIADTIGTFIGSNAYYNTSYQFIPNYTAASGINFRQDGSTEFWNDTGLTSGTTYTPTKRIVILNSGNVGIGTGSPTAPLHVVTTNMTGSIAIFSAPSSMGCSISTSGTTCSSDIRLKENIESIDSLLGLNDLLKVRPVHFTWKSDNKHIKQTGFIAQELEKIFPEFVKTDDKGFKQVNYAHFVSVLTSGVQGLYKKIMNYGVELTEAKREIAALKKENEEIKNRLSEIEKNLKKMNQ